jgi:hypothetical protein
MKLLENIERVCEQTKHLNIYVFFAMRVHTHTCHRQEFDIGILRQLTTKTE